MIAILGATGNIGRPLVDLLAKQKQALRVLTRDPSKPLPLGVERVQGELNKSSLDRLMDGAEKLFLLVPPAAGPETEAMAIEAAKAARVKRVVKLSTIGAGTEPPQGLGVHHLERERLLQASGLGWTVLRPGFFMSNALQWVPQIRDRGAVRTMFGDGTFHPIAPQDIAAVAALVLTAPGHEGQIYELTGEEPVTAARQLSIIGRTLKRPIDVVDVSPEEAAADLRARGTPERNVAPLVDLWRNVRANKVAMRTETVRTLLGRAPMTFEEWCAQHLPRL